MILVVFALCIMKRIKIVRAVTKTPRLDMDNNVCIPLSLFSFLLSLPSFASRGFACKCRRVEGGFIGFKL
jgi:hypothetical protein